MLRGMHLLPKARRQAEWSHTQDYWREKDQIPVIDLDDAAFVYEAIEKKADRPAETAKPKELA